MIDTELRPLLPDFYKGISDYQQMMDAESSALEDLDAAMIEVKDNLYFQTMDADTVEAWEQFLGVQKTDSDTLEFRRQRILDRISNRPPFTIYSLIEKLNELLGEGNFFFNMDQGGQTLYIYTAAANPGEYAEIRYLGDQMKPAHIAFRVVPELITKATVRTIVSYQENGTGDSWVVPQLSGSSLDAIGTQVINAINQQTTKILIDGGDIGVAPTKTITPEGHLEVSYPVEAYPGLEVIRELTLADNNYNPVLTSNVFIPVASDFTMTQDISVKGETT